MTLDIDRLSPSEKRAALAALLQRGPRERVAPLTFAQEGLWLLDTLAPGSGVYNVPWALELRGELNGAAFQRALDEIVRRHEPLRATFRLIDGAPKQVIAPHAAVEVPVVDLTALAPPERDGRVLQLAREEARRPFDLSSAPLLRATLVRRAAADHVLLLCLHHLVADGWSMGVLVREMAALYHAFQEGRPSPLPPLAGSYTDHAARERAALEAGALEPQLAYWRRQLSGARALELPADRPRPPIQTGKGAGCTFDVPSTLAADLDAVASGSGATLFMTLLAALKVVLHRYTGEQDVVIGSAVANRRRGETEGLIGLFVNSVVLRTDLSGDPTFRELLERVRTVTLGAYENQDLPFERLVGELQPGRDLSRQPLFQLTFLLQNFPLPSLELPGLELRLLEVPAQTSKYDLSLYMHATPGGLRGHVEYAADLFEPATVRQLILHFETLLASAAADPDARLSALSMTSSAERHRVTCAWNATATAVPEKRVHEMFEEQVVHTPEAVAVSSPQGQLTYRELNQRANRLARHLRAAGARLEDRIGICMERSADAVVAILGVLKAGAAYVPLAPAQPAPRLRFMVEDAGISLCLTQASLAEVVGAAGVPTFCVDRDGAELSGYDGDDLSTVGTLDHLAYVIYTSGSTGRPKGVLVEHRNLTHSTAARRAYYPERVAAFYLTSPFFFDSSVAGLFWTLCQGGRLVLAPEGFQHSLPDLPRVLQEQEITHILCLPSVHALLLDHCRPGELDALRCVVVAGEACPADLPSRHAAALPNAALYNEYGPTEAAVWSTVHDCASTPGRRVVPIGRAIPNARTYVLDGELAPAAIDVPGELFIAGDGVARGYQGRPDLTAERFIPDPFATSAGGRLYRTGDRARYRADGTLEFLGRVDGQVKVRGYRIEVEEIETALRAHVSIRDAAVIAASLPGSTDVRLTAYVECPEEREVSPDALRRWLAARLPEYMIPSAFLRIDALPRTGTGKLDRRALAAGPPAHPLRDEASRAPADERLAPLSPTEAALCSLFAELLGVDHIRTTDNFFDLGGHSLLGARAVSRVRERLGVELPLRALFEAQTVSALSRVVEELQQRPAGRARPSLLAHVGELDGGPS